MATIKTKVFFSIVWFFLAAGAVAYDYDPNDFAAEVIEYVEGTGVGSDWLSGQKFNDPCTALDRPTIDTTGDGWYIPIDENVPLIPACSAFRAFELVTIGFGGHLVVKFNHPISNDRNNPYGIDFVSFGNAFKVIGDGQGWTNGNPNATTVEGSGFIEPGIVSVSQDGQTWYCFTNDANFSDDPNFIIDPDCNDGPFVDDFAPTLGRIYNPNEPNTSIGEWNQWWAEPTNPTLPLDTSLSFASFDGNTVAEICQVYGESAGGTGFDIDSLDLPVDPNTGLKWIRYVRVDNPADSGHTPEIDAFADVACCGDWKHPFPEGDLNQDCRVDSGDVEIFCNYWLEQISTPEEPAAADMYHDDENIVNFYDWAVLAGNWLKCTWQCE